MSELKPCPFCGGVPLLSEGPYDYDGGDRYYYYRATFECTCGLTFEVMNTLPKVYLSSESALDFAYDARNTRAERTCCNVDDHKAVWFICSECGHVKSLKHIGNYCPNCGAKVVDA